MAWIRIVHTFFSVSSLCRWWQSNAAFDKSTSQIWSKTCTLYNAFKYHSIQLIKLHCTHINIKIFTINPSHECCYLQCVYTLTMAAWLWHPLSVIKVHAHWNLDLFSTLFFFPTFVLLMTSLVHLYFHHKLIFNR